MELGQKNEKGKGVFTESFAPFNQSSFTSMVIDYVFINPMLYQFIKSAEVKFKECIKKILNQPQTIIERQRLGYNQRWSVEDRRWWVQGMQAPTFLFEALLEGRKREKKDILR